MFTTVLCLLLSVSVFAQDRKCLAESALSTSESTRFTAHSSGAVLDNKTNLIWKKCFEGQSGDQCEGEVALLNWGQALVYASAEKASDSGWRLPNIRELGSIVELRCTNPAINSDVFANLSAQHVWSSSPYQFYTHYSWYLDLSNGAATYDERIREKALLLVKSNRE